MKRLIFIVSLSIAFLSCQKYSTEPSIRLDNFTFKTDKVSYRSEEPIGISVNNGTQVNVYFSSCGCEPLSFFIEKKINGYWQEHSKVGIICLAIYQICDIPIPSNSTYNYILSIHQTGTFRLKFPYGFQKNNTWNYSVYSNEFVVD